MENIIISVIIPTFNGERTILRAIDSVLNQKGYRDHFDLELMVYDDCSIDKTVELIKSRMVICGGQLHVSNKNSGGPNAGRNWGIKNALGNYFAFLDQDDEWLLNKLELQLKEIKNGAELVYSSFVRK